jgi:hypothetical protein
MECLKMEIETRLRKCCPKCGSTLIKKIRRCQNLEDRGFFHCDKCKVTFRAPFQRRIQEHSLNIPVLKKIIDEKNRIKLNGFESDEK